MHRSHSTAILLAAGNGHRMQGCVEDKILAPLGGAPVFLYSIRAFLRSGCINRFTVVYRDEPQKEQLQASMDPSELGGIPIDWVAGGSERQHSVENALAAQSDDCRYVFIHDCARPLISAQSIQSLDQAVRRDGAATLAHPVIDTIKRIPEPGQFQSVPLEDLDRDRLWAMETPQAFDYAKIRAAYAQVRKQQLRVTDDCAAAAMIGLHATLVHNPDPNPKLTTPADINYIEHLLNEWRIADGDGGLPEMAQQ